MPTLGAMRDFFAAQTGGRPLGVARVGVGMSALLLALVTRRDMLLLFAPDAVRGRWIPWVPDISPDWLDVYIGLWIVAVVLFTAGMFARWAGMAVVACIVYRFMVDQSMYWAPIYLCGLLTLLLTIGNSGTGFSVDAWRRGGEQPVPRWPLTLYKIQISLVYLFAALEKMHSNFLLSDFIVQSVPLIGMLDWPPLIRLAAFGTVGFEVWLSFALWSRRFQRWAFLLGFLFHTAILFCIGFYAALLAYAAMFVSSYAAFIEAVPESRRVVWQRDDLFARRWIPLLRRLDWLKIHRWEEETGELRVETDTGALTGWRAFTEILAVLPATFFWSAALELPLIRHAGERFYRGYRG